MKQDIKAQLNEMKNWAFSVVGMIFALFVPFIGLFFILVGLVYAIFLYRQNKKAHFDLLIFNIIAFIMVTVIGTVSLILTLQEINDALSSLF
jgi:hypothetical protein